jgi:ankyrin repeat protein
MKVKHLFAIGIAGLLVATGGFAAGSSDVADAAMRGDNAAVRTLITQGADVNARQGDGSTALHWAVYKGNMAMVEALIAAGADVKAATREGATPLSLASVNGDAAALAALLKAGADPNQPLRQGKTALMEASRSGNVEAIRVLLDRGANLNVKESLRGTTALMWAASEGHAAAVQLLIQRGADFKARSAPGPRSTRGGGAGGKAGDPRKAIAALAAAIAATQAGADQSVLSEAAAASLRGGSATPVTSTSASANAANAAATLAALDNDQDDAPARGGANDGGELTPLVYAVKANDLESVKVLLAAGADVNQVTGYGWSPLLVATQNRFYRLGAFLLERGADPNLTNRGGWTPLYLATDNRNIEGGDYPVRKSDMDHLEFIKLLLDKGANVNARMRDNTDTRTVFTGQWLDENGATAFFRASQSGDVVLMKLLLAYGADPHMSTVLGVTPLQVASGIGWVEGITYEWSREQTLEAVKLLLELGLDPNSQAATGRTSLHGAGTKGATAVVQVLVDHGARLDVRDFGNTDNRGSVEMATHTWLPVDYADGLVRTGVQSAIPRPETGLLIRKLMAERGMFVPPVGRTVASVCIVELCK